MIHVTLTPNELAFAAGVGVDRRMSHVRNPNPGRDKNANGKFKWDYDIESAAAEMAWCKEQNIYWSGIGKIGAKDGGIVEIRWVSEIGYGLINYPSDNDQTFYVIVEGIMCNKWIYGGKRARACKTPEHWIQSKGYWLTPREEIKELFLPELSPEVRTQQRADEESRVASFLQE